MVAAKSSRVNRQYKKKYRIRNWREYERGLRSRGDVTIWLSEDAIAAWVPPKNGLRGGQRRYSNLAVRTALTLRVVFSLPLRQTEGFLDSLLRLMGLNLKAPDHTTLSRRNQIVAVPPLTRSHDGPIDLIVDSTGLKILGCGEWNAHKHKASKKRRDWRKLHIGVDAEGFIVAAELTASSRDDASTLPALLDTIEVSVVAWIGAEMEFARSQAVASGDAFEHRPPECGHCVQNFLDDLDLRDLPGEAARFELGADHALPTTDLRFYPAALVVPCGHLPDHAAVAADLGNMAIPNGWIPRRLRSDHCVLRRRYNPHPGSPHTAASAYPV